MTVKSSGKNGCVLPDHVGLGGLVALINGLARIRSIYFVSGFEVSFFFNLFSGQKILTTYSTLYYFRVYIQRKNSFNKLSYARLSTRF